ncbi:MAG: caspase domain-containing protein [Nevskiaceae bacterium]
MRPVRQFAVFACLGALGLLGPLASAQIDNPVASRPTSIGSMGAWNPVVAWTVDETTGLVTINIRAPGRKPIAGGRVDGKPFGRDPDGRKTVTHQLSPGPYRFTVTVRDELERVYEQLIVGSWGSAVATNPSPPPVASPPAAVPAPSVTPVVAGVADWRPNITWKVDEKTGALTLAVDSVDGREVTSVLVNGLPEPGSPAVQRSIIRQLVPGAFRLTVVASNASGHRFQQAVVGAWQGAPQLPPSIAPAVTPPPVMVAERKWEPRVEWELDPGSGDVRVTVTADGNAAIASVQVAGVDQGGAKDGRKVATYKVKPGDFSFLVSATDATGRVHNQHVAGTWKAPAPPVAAWPVAAPPVAVAAAKPPASTVPAAQPPAPAVVAAAVTTPSPVVSTPIPSVAKVMPVWQPDINWTLDSKTGVVSVTVDSIDGRAVNTLLIDGMDVGGNSGLKRALSRGVAPGEFSFVVSAVDPLGQVANKVIAGNWKLPGRAPAPATAAAKANFAKNVFAIVIGNSKYSFGPLENPKNDANAIAKKLRDFGYDVEVIFDASRNQIVEALSASLSRAEKADVNLLYYAGHGVQINGVNYLVPTDVSLTNTETLQFSAVKISEIIDNFMPAKTRLVFLDACRDNPLARSLRRSRNAAGSGLAAMDVASGTLISYATKDGSVALDNAGASGGNSPYAKALLEHLGEPLDITLVLRKVRQKVLDDTNNQQIPWDYGSLTGSELILGRASNP